VAVDIPARRFDAAWVRIGAGPALPCWKRVVSPACDRFTLFCDIGSLLQDLVDGLGGAAQLYTRVLDSQILDLLLPAREDRRGAVLKDDDLLHCPRIGLRDHGQEVLQGAQNTEVGCLTVDDDPVVLEQHVEEAGIEPGQGLTAQLLDFGAEDRVVLGQGVIPLGLQEHLGVAQQAMVESGLEQRGHEGMIHCAEHGVKGPDEELEETLPLQLFAVLDALDAVLIVGVPLAGLDVVHADLGERLWMLTLIIDPPSRMEDLVLEVGIQSGCERRPGLGIGEKKLGGSDAVLLRILDIQRSTWVAEPDLEVDREHDRRLDILVGLGDGPTLTILNRLCVDSVNQAIGPQLRHRHGLQLVKSSRSLLGFEPLRKVTRCEFSQV